jgi:hypothetical protein
MRADKSASHRAFVDGQVLRSQRRARNLYAESSGVFLGVVRVILLRVGLVALQ